VRYEDDRWRFRLGVALALAVLGVGWLVRGGLPQRVQRAFREPGPQPRLLGIPGVDPGLYVNNDKWAGYLAPESVCPGGEDAGATEAEQETTMLCLINFARRRAGRNPLEASPVLSLAASFKARDIVKCRQFAHTACGKDAHAVANEAGYPPVSWGENLYLGHDARGAPRPALDGWLNSPHHRENLLDPLWTEQGIALREAKHFTYGVDAAVWASEFGAPPQP
jgi:uncharacterized protein YkwD